MSLQPFGTFKEHLSPHLAPVKTSQRNYLLKSIYRLAKRKAEMERLRDYSKKEAQEIRTSRIHHERVLAQLQNAIRSLELAESAADDPKLLVNLEVEKAKGLLREAAADVRWVAQEMLPALIHPELRTSPEKSVSTKPLRHPAVFPGFGVAEIDYWFIAELEKCLDGCASPAGLRLRPADYDRIISRAFEAAFQEGAYAVSRIKTARGRIAKRRGQALQPSLQN